MRRLLFLLFISFFLISCGTKKKTNIIQYSTPLSSQEEVKVIGLGQQLESTAILVGSISVGEAGFTTTSKCTYSEVLKEARILARSIGGNIIQITSHKEPDDWSSCHRIKADVYLITP